jgi:hypothetical protein
VSASKLGENVANVTMVLSCFMLLFVLGRDTLGRRASVAGPKNWAMLPDTFRHNQAPSFALETLSGDTAILPRPASPSLLIAYSTTCVFCEASLRNWQRLARRLCRVQIVLLSAEAIDIQRDYWADRDLTTNRGCTPPVIGRVTDIKQFVNAYGLRGTPTHYVIGNDGKIRRMWRGAVARRAAHDSIAAAFEKD